MANEYAMLHIFDSHVPMIFQMKCTDLNVVNVLLLPPTPPEPAILKLIRAGSPLAAAFQPQQ